MNKNLGYFISLCLIAIVISQDSQYRLPNLARPINYTLTIETFLNNFTFRGSVDIYVEILTLTNRLVLHSSNLTILDKRVSDAVVQHGLTDLTKELLILVLDRVLVNGAVHKIHLDFNGTISTEVQGYYRAAYANETGHTRYLAVTDFEATSARRAFPCFDEPNYKAAFQINLIRHKDYISTSNMDKVGQFNLLEDRVHDVYNITFEMSTYLVAFMVSDYHNVSLPRNGINYRTFGRPELIDRGEGAYSLQVGPHAIESMQNFTNLPYPILKLDSVAVPNEYYRVGAMENWGMVTYRERYLMYNSSTTTASEKQFILEIVTHELSHQWFGNLVTPEWWNYIWLSEGFATYFQTFAAYQMEPSWNFRDQFVIRAMQTAFESDSLESTTPMRRNVQTPDEISEIFDDIVYEKAGSVIRMASNFLGQSQFQNGLRYYLQTWQFQNVNPSKLYNSWQRFVGNAINVTDIMTSWETQTGYPVVTVTRLANGTALLNQQRFFQYTTNDTNRTLWPIPLNWFTVNTTTPEIRWFNIENDTLNLNINNTQWVIFNNNRTGFYRVNYELNNWRLITNYLRTGNFPAIGVLNRAQLIDDAFSLARSLRLSYSIALDLGTYVVNETEYVPVAAFTNAFAHLDRLSTGQSHHNTMSDYGRNILEGYFNRTGFIQQNDAHLLKLAKTTVLTWLCKLNHQPCRNNSALIFGNWISSSVPIQPDSQQYIFCNGIRDSNENSWNIAFQRYSTIREAPQRTRLAQGLGCANNTIVLRRLLDMVILENSVFNSTDKEVIVGSVITNNGVLGVSLVLDWLTQNFNQINKTFESLSTIINGVAFRITTSDQLALFARFNYTHAGNFSAAVNTTFSTAFNRVQTNLVWINSTSNIFDNHFNGSGSFISAQIYLIVSALIIQLMPISLIVSFCCK